MPTRIRNHIARSALLRKGGVHEKGRSAHRQADKRKLEKTVSDYLSNKETATAEDGSGRFSLSDIFETSRLFTRHKFSSRRIYFYLIPYFQIFRHLNFDTCR